MIRVVIMIKVLLVCLMPVYGQNVGIGETNPAAKLEVKGSSSTLLNSLHVKDGLNNTLLSVSNQGRVGINILNPEVPLHIHSGFADEMVRIRGGFPYISFHNQSHGYAGYLWSNGVSFELGTPVGSGIPVTIAPGLGDGATFMPGGNVGIGIAEPLYRLDVNGRMRLHHFGQTAGIFFNNSSNTDAPAFVGMENNTSVGFYGNGIGWGMVMNVNNGNVNIAGNATADNFLFTVPATRYLCIPHSAFSAGNSSEQMFKQNGGAWLTNGISNLQCPVYLPHGATITNVGFNVLDVGGSSDLECTLYRQAITTGPGSSAIPEAMAGARTGGNPGNTVISDNTIVSPVVNSQGYFYYVVVRNVIFSGSTVQPWEGSFMQVYGVTITYTINSVP